MHCLSRVQLERSVNTLTFICVNVFCLELGIIVTLKHIGIANAFPCVCTRLRTPKRMGQVHTFKYNICNVFGFINKYLFIFTMNIDVRLRCSNLDINLSLLTAPITCVPFLHLQCINVSNKHQSLRLTRNVRCCYTFVDKNEHTGKQRIENFHIFYSCKPAG